MELWEDIVGVTNYQISNLGNVKRLKHKKPRGKSSIQEYRTYKEAYLSPYVGTNGYVVVNIVGKPYYVHRLIAIAFIPNPEHLPEINHIDCNKTNNELSNLEWCTRQQNAKHAQENGLYAKKKKVNV